MFDVQLRAVIDPGLNHLAYMAARTGITANIITTAGAVLAVGAGYAVSRQSFLWALTLIAVNRLLDGLDGAIARINGPTTFGGYLDSIADYVFYVAVPVGFGLAAKENVVAAMILIAAFTLTAVSFLAYAAIAAKLNVEETHGPKAFFYSAGLMEGGETIGFFAVMCIFPAYFVPLAWIFVGLCCVTILQRLMLASQQFGRPS